MTLPSSEQLQRGLIVSVQAPKGSPINDPLVIGALAEASLMNGAIGILVEGPEQVGEVRRRCPKAFVIGLWKRFYPDSPIFITPGWKELKTIWAAGADCIAMDATARTRPDEQSLKDLVGRARNELGAVLIADIDSLENGLRAKDLGFHWLSTALYGYTEETVALTPPGFILLESLRENIACGTRIICEGGLTSTQQVNQAFAYGADNVVVGSPITEPQHLVAACCQDIDIAA